MFLALWFHKREVWIRAGPGAQSIGHLVATQESEVFERNIERKLNVKASRTRWIFLTTIAASRHVDIPALKATGAIPVLLFSYRFYHVIVKSWVSPFFLSLFFLTCQNGYSVHLSLEVARGILQYMKGTFSPSRSTRLLFCLLSQSEVRNTVLENRETFQFFYPPPLIKMRSPNTWSSFLKTRHR